MSSPFTTCHSLPCNIEYSGKAPVNVYFQPAELEDGKYQAATFRGRGLLAKNDVGNSTVKVEGRLLQVVSSSSSDTKQLKEVATFDQYTEWYHEHQVQAVEQRATSANRWSTALEWMEIAVALHAPLPLPDGNK